MAIQYSSNFEETVAFSDDCAQIALTANVEQTYTVPGASSVKCQLRFSYTSTSNVFVCWKSTPTVPGGASVGTQQYNEFRPGADGSKRYASGGDVIHLITPDATAYVGIAVVQVPY